MKINFIYKFTGYLSVLIGIAASLCIYRPSFMVYGIGFSLAGFVIAGVNIFLNLISTKKWYFYLFFNFPTLNNP